MYKYKNVKYENELKKSRIEEIEEYRSKKEKYA